MHVRYKVLIGVLLVVAAMDWPRQLYLGGKRAEVDLDVDTSEPDAPHDVALRILGPRKEFLAEARSVEHLGFVLAIHPDPTIGNCRHLNAAPDEYRVCFNRYMAWCAEWAPLARAADVRVDTCELQQVPLINQMTPMDMGFDDWLLSWLGPILRPHGAYLPRRNFKLDIRINRWSCSVAQ